MIQEIKYCNSCKKDRVSFFNKTVFINNEKSDICDNCYIERIESDDVNFRGSVLCKTRGCANDCNEFSKYCNNHYEEIYNKTI